DAVKRILTVKFAMGLFEHPTSDPSRLADVGSDAQRALAREAVSKSMVLLQNNNGALPIAKDVASIVVAGKGANDIGIQSGGRASPVTSRQARRSYRLPRQQSRPAQM